MSALVIDRPRQQRLDDMSSAGERGAEGTRCRGVEGARRVGMAEALHRSSGGRMSVQTLSDLIAGTWEELVVYGSARCPVCAGKLGIGGSESIASCAGCGTQLS